MNECSLSDKRKLVQSSGELVGINSGNNDSELGDLVEYDIGTHWGSGRGEDLLLPTSSENGLQGYVQFYSDRDTNQDTDSRLCYNFRHSLSFAPDRFFRQK